MLKSIIFLVSSLLVVSFSFAGVHGGGVMMNMTSTSSPEFAPVRNAFDSSSSPKIVYNISEKNGAVKFAYGQLVDRQWKTLTLEAQKENVEKNSELSRALSDSSATNSWIEMK